MLSKCFKRSSVITNVFSERNIFVYLNPYFVTKKKMLTQTNARRHYWWYGACSHGESSCFFRLCRRQHWLLARISLSGPYPPLPPLLSGSSPAPLSSLFFTTTSSSENAIIEHYASLTNFWNAENIPKLCLFEIILSEILLHKNFTKYGQLYCNGS